MDKESRTFKTAGGEVTLTETEFNIVRLVSDGRSNSEAAKKLELSSRTVETYRLRLMQKLGLCNVVELVKFAVREGIVSLHEDIPVRKYLVPARSH